MVTHTHPYTSQQVMELSSFMSYLAKGLEDKDDVQLLAHQILAKVTQPSSCLLILSGEIAKGCVCTIPSTDHTKHALLCLLTFPPL